MQPNSSLIKFHLEYCSDYPIDSLQVFYKLLEELNKLKIETNGVEKDDYSICGE